jgi:hypothetical protein
MEFYQERWSAVKRLIALILNRAGGAGHDRLRHFEPAGRDRLRPRRRNQPRSRRPCSRRPPAPDAGVPTPVPVVEIKDYKYQKVTNEPLKISFEYPSHWINHPGIHHHQLCQAGE